MSTSDNISNLQHPPACETFYTALTSYLWGETSKAESRAIEEHRLACPNCQEYFVAAENALCREMFPLVQAYLDRELSAEDRGQFERHISVCERCRQHYQFDGRIAHFVQKRISISPAHESDVERLVESFRAKLRERLTRTE
ncbi:MAG: zf-HC2 domain-containing protein [Chloroflexota bacterium]